MHVLAIDPGPEHSAWVLVGSGVDAHRPILSRIDENRGVCALVRSFRDSMFRDTVLAIEMIASYGMPVGASVFETCVWIGRFIEAWGNDRVKLVYRRDVKLHLCGSPRAKDAHIRQALIDLYGGTREKAIGTKKAPGPLYGIKRDMWSALAVARTFLDGGGEGS